MDVEILEVAVVANNVIIAFLYSIYFKNNSNSSRATWKARVQGPTGPTESVRDPEYGNSDMQC